MSLYIASINSGSNGNCYYVGSQADAVLVDAGISCRETERRMKRLGLNMNKVRAIFISHEHSDHIRGIETLAHKYQLPVYITPATLLHGGLKIQSHLLKDFNELEPITIGNLNITAFSKLHDAVHPHSFSVTCDGVTVGVFTDLGDVCQNLISHFSRCHAAFLEANYDADMLNNGRYPYFLKRRISGGKGHLSNAQALELFITHRPSYMSHLLLAHLSQDNNSPELVQQMFDSHRGETFVTVASRHEESAVYHVRPEGVRIPDAAQPVQFSLF